jgi:hypothetical protein
MPDAHSKFSASGFEQVMLCPGSMVMQQGMRDNGNRYSAEGTAAHQVLTWALQEDRPAAAFIGRIIMVEDWTFEVDQDMADHVQVCVDYVNDVKGPEGVVLVDQRVNYASYLGLPEDAAWGTLDVAVLRDDEVIGIDFKYGMGVEVSAERNPQISLYVLGILTAVNGLLGDFTRARLVISQPRIKKAPSEWDCSVEDLEHWAHTTARSAVATCLNAERTSGENEDRWVELFLRPTEKGCKFCKAKATCPALRAEVAATVFDAPPATPDEFDAAETVMPTHHDWLANCLTKVDLIEDWCKAIRAEAEKRLLAGQPVPGYKLVQGKRGARQWLDAKAVEEKLKAMRLKQEEMFEFKLISPTTAEKLHKAGTIGPRQWPTLQELITQSEGKPHVAPVTDSRPAIEIRPVVEDFTNLADNLA